MTSDRRVRREGDVSLPQRADRLVLRKGKPERDLRYKRIGQI
jgi:hypothetical protein